jgi:neutral ceramidase
MRHLPRCRKSLHRRPDCVMLIRKVQRLIHCVVIALLLSTGSYLHAATFKAAVAKVNITPPPGLPMYGFLDRINENKLSAGTLDPLYARVLVLEVGAKRLALVTLDLGRTFNEAELAQLRREVKTVAGVAYLIVTASHTHSGPNILDVYPGDRAPEWEAGALRKIVGAVSEATGRLVEARIGTGRGEVYIGYNRRQMHPDGSVAMLWTNPAKQPTSPVDSTVLVLRIDDSRGNPIALLINYACHPVVLGSDNLQYSADFVGPMTSTVEAGFDHAPQCFFLQGGDGDINSYYASTNISDGAIAKRDWTGKELGDQALRVAKGIKTELPGEPAIDFADDVMSFSFRWNAKAFRAGLLSNYGPKVFEDHADLLVHDPIPDHMELHVTTLLLNKRIALIGLPGEPFVNFQINWRDQSPLKDAFFLGYTNGYFDYFPTIEAAAQGGYGAGDSNTYVELGAGERMLRQGLTRVYEMLGKFRDAPDRD